MAEYIEREAVIDRITNLMQLQAPTAREIIEAIPAADVRPVVRGKWIPVDEKEDAFDCSECDAMVSKRCNFCPGCGADMRKEENDG